MFIRLLLSFVWVFTSGFILVSLILKSKEEDFIDIGLRLGLGMGVGFGLASFNFVLWQMVFDPKTKYFVIGEVLILVLLIGIYLGKLKPYRNLAQLKPKLNVGKPSLLGYIFIILTSLAIVVHLQGFTIRPQGGWDAWMIWNKHARFLFRDHTLWLRLFSKFQQHPDYPLLLPSNVARAWSYMGKESPFAPALIGFVFTFGILGLLVIVTRKLRGSKVGYLAGFILLGAPAFHVHGPTQSSDFLLAFFLLGALALLNIFEEDRNDHRHLILVGIFFALTTWTKNEGWLIILLFMLVRTLTLVYKGEKERIRHEAIPLLLGAVPILIFVLLYKVIFTPANDLISGQGAASLERLTDIPRYIRILQEFLWQIIRIDPKYSVPFIILPIFGLIFGLKPDILRRQITLTNILIPIFILAGYYLIFLMTPHDLDWHLYTANTRLFFQVWPISVLAVVLIIKNASV